jgi:hypothetical protein
VKVLALTEGPNHVCFRYRLEAFAEALADRGWTLESLPLAPNTFERSPQLREARDADVVILQRKLLPLWQLRRLRKMSKVLIYDFDDALYCRDSYARKGHSSWTRLAHFWATIYAADAVTAGNPYLAEQAATYVGPEKVHLAPTCISPAIYAPAKHQRRDRPVRLTWIGQHATLPCLYLADPHLEAATARTPNIELRVVCNQFPRLHGIRVVPRQWTQSTEAQELADSDIGISYLPDDEWSRGKCGLKVLQYMAAGLPVIANPVGMNCSMVEHGRTGFLAKTPAEWSEAVSKLANNPELRASMGAAGRRVVERRFSVERWAPELASLVDRLGHAAAQGATSPSAIPDNFVLPETLSFADDEAAGQAA